MKTKPTVCIVAIFLSVSFQFPVNSFAQSESPETGKASTAIDRDLNAFEMLQIQLNNAIAIADSIKSVYFADSTKSNIKNSSVIIANDQFFSFTIVEYHFEKSKDSNQSSTTISLEKNTLYFTYEYRGFPGSRDEKKQIALNNSTIHTIKTKLKELSLYRNYKKTFPADSRGPSTTTGFNLTILIDSNEYNLKVEVEGQQSINDQIYLDIRSFYSYVKNLFPLSKNY